MTQVWDTPIGTHIVNVVDKDLRKLKIYRVAGDAETGEFHVRLDGEDREPLLARTRGFRSARHVGWSLRIATPFTDEFAPAVQQVTPPQLHIAPPVQLNIAPPAGTLPKVALQVAPPSVQPKLHVTPPPVT